MTQEAERQATSRAPHSGLQRLFEQYGTAHIVDEHYETAVSSNLSGLVVMIPDNGRASWGP